MAPGPHSASRRGTRRARIPSPSSLRATSYSMFSHRSRLARVYPLALPSSRFHRATAGSLIRHFRDCVKGAPRELYANVLLTAGPADKDSLVVVQICFVGPRARGQEYLDAISAWNGEQCLLNEVDEKSFVHQQESVAQVLRAKGACSRADIVRWRVAERRVRRCSGQAVVHPLGAHLVAPGRRDQQDGARVRRHAHRMQCVPALSSPRTLSLT